MRQVTRARRRVRPPFVVALIVSVLAAGFVGCGGPAKQPPTRPPDRSGKSVAATTPGRAQEGIASWYGGKHHGGPTASGERFDKNAMTAAHRTLRMNTRVRVTNKRNGRSVVVRINDRGPYTKGRIIDVSEAAARQLGMIERGIVPVRVEVISSPPGRRP
jgi:rare lipoprotein A